eukprot:gene45160-55241_t
MVGLKHNPYVGTFHVLPTNEESASTPISSSILTGSKNNPLVGVFRHSPSVISRSLGLKVGVMLQNANTTSAPIISRLQAPPKETPALTLSKRNFVASLRQIPVKKYSSTLSSVTSAPEQSDHANIASNELPADLRSNRPTSIDDTPVCAICLEKYADGDEILTLACSHCFHADCASKWFFHTCLNTADISSAFSCPQCRQDHVTLSEASSQVGSSSENNMTGLETGIGTQSFLSLGQNLLRDGGYDFLSDCTSEPPQSVSKPRLAGVVPAVHHLLPCEEASSSSSAASPAEGPAGRSPGQLHTRTGEAEAAVPVSGSAELDQYRQDSSGDHEMLSAHVPDVYLEPDGLQWSAYSDCGIPLHS